MVERIPGLKSIKSRPAMEREGVLVIELWLLKDPCILLRLPKDEWEKQGEEGWLQLL